MDFLYSGDNGLVAFVFIMICISLAEISSGRKRIRLWVRRKWFACRRYAKFIKYCRIHRRELMAMIEHKERVVDRERRMSLLKN